MIVLLLGLVGLILGSFVNALVWRTYKQQSSNQSEYSILKGRSMCPKCKHTLQPIDLIPVMSWVMSKGKCRYCKRSISVQYPLVEVATAALLISLYVFWPFDLNNAFHITNFIFWVVYSVGFMALSVYDIKWMEIPNKIIYPLIYLAVISIILRAVYFGSGANVIQDAFWGVLVAGGFFIGLFYISSGKWIGGGDVRIGVLLGLILGGPLDAAMVIFVSALLGTIFSLPLILSKKIGTKSLIPYGPFLLGSAILVQLFGSRWIEMFFSAFVL